MIELNESNFKQVLDENDKLIVLFYREKGCSHCDNFKPVFEKFAETSDVVCGMYKIPPQPDSIATEKLIKSFPTTVSYLNGEILKVQPGANINLNDMFKPNIIPVKDAPLISLLTDEANLIDAIYPLKVQLLAIQEEIKKRKENVG